jgi:phosphatidylglycerophosphate synthase
MLDRMMLALTKPAVDRLARSAHAAGLSANQISLVGFGFGLTAAFAISQDHFTLAIIPLLLNRMMDGLDGAVARLGATSDRGAFLDVTLDFLFYAAVPLAFAFSDPVENALAAAVLLASFIGTGVSFLAYAIIAAKRGETNTAYPSKGFYYLGGLTEGFETVVCFVAMCFFPQHFAIFASIFATLCAVTTLTRLVAGWRAFGR